MNKDTENYFVVIPYPVFISGDLLPIEKLVYGEVSALCNKSGYCYASNAYIADVLKTSTRTIRRSLLKLKDLKLIKVDLTIEQKENTQRKIYLNLNAVHDMARGMAIHGLPPRTPMATKSISKEYNKEVGKPKTFKNVDNVGITKDPVGTPGKGSKNVDIKIPQGQTSLLDYSPAKRLTGAMKSVRDIIFEKTNPRTGKNEETMRIKTSHQAYGLAAAADLNLPKEYHSRIIKRCKDRQLHEIQNAISATNKKRIIDDDGRFKFFITCLNTGDNLSKMPGHKMDRTRQTPGQIAVS